MSFDYAVPVARPRISPDAAPHVHRPKVELFDVKAMENIDPKGFRRTVDEYRLEHFGLFMARKMDGHPKLAYIESWLLPDPGLRVTRWHRHPGTPRGEDVYIDLVEVDTEFGARTGAHGPVWRMVDIYLDIHVHTGDRLEVVDTDELLAALNARMIDAETAQRALERTYRTVDGITRHGYDTDAWLASLGIDLTWQDQGKHRV
ncbi:DUF402 domain-containing protein [Kibdelosporangium phytohabitans]|uniref:DUF402 domain-containing protein n=1 Tax=Kibdelosporangium phytohabitans TaxID=860235 RepID=UPI0019E5F8DB|nr:DUF402 domain-containing protein [Kibdelosporangium phytohabitans]MBE1464022.1 putative RNA-binding protein associated with RNAse of E/G family [Kibdelosporangium phytohabitans]